MAIRAKTPTLLPAFCDTNQAALSGGFSFSAMGVF